jgi:hypothetical protein
MYKYSPLSYHFLSPLTAAHTMTQNMDTDAALASRSSSFSMTELLDAINLLSRGGSGECYPSFLWPVLISCLQRDHAYPGWS